jgi:hypothetical protein
MLADILDLKTPIKVDLRAQGIIASASRSLVEEILAEQGLLTTVITADPVPVTIDQGQRSPSLRPSSFLLEDGLPVSFCKGGCPLPGQGGS